MTESLQRAFAEAAKLPSEEQDALADWLLYELRSEGRWEQSFAASRPTLTKLAAEALVEHRDGKSRVLDPDKL
jgi:hypothetical protein